MGSVSATLEIRDDAPAVVAGLLSRFAKGTRVSVRISEIVPTPPQTDLDGYRRLVASARQQAPRAPWRTTAETMQAIREGEAD